VSDIRVKMTDCWNRESGRSERRIGSTLLRSGLRSMSLRRGFRDRLAHRALQLAFAREDLALVEVQCGPVEVGHLAARVGDDQRTGRDVPRPQPEFPQRVNRSGA
jgi:hypothetical protein